MTGQVSDGGHGKEEQENNPLFLRPCDSECYCEKKKMIGHGGGAIERERERKEKGSDIRRDRRRHRQRLDQISFSSFSPRSNFFLPPCSPFQREHWQTF